MKKCSGLERSNFKEETRSMGKGTVIHLKYTFVRVKSNRAFPVEVAPQRPHIYSKTSPKFKKK